MSLDPVAILNYLGLTVDKVFPLVVVALMLAYFLYKMLVPIKKSLTRITNACIEMQTIAETNGSVLHHNLIEAPGSPLAPTLYGVKLINDSGLGTILDTKKEYLHAELKKRLPKRPAEYDVQEAARAMLLEMKDQEITNPVKTYAYKNGLNVDVILRVGGLWLRDDFFWEMNGISAIQRRMNKFTKNPSLQAVERHSTGQKTAPCRLCCQGISLIK